MTYYTTRKWVKNHIQIFGAQCLPGGYPGVPVGLGSIDFIHS